MLCFKGTKSHIILNPYNDKKYYIVNSDDNPEILVNYKSLIVKFTNKDNNVSDLMKHSRYFILAGGSQICRGYYDPNKSLLFSEDIPFNLLEYHNLKFIFDLTSLLKDINIDDINIYFYIIESQKDFDRKDLHDLIWICDEKDTITKLRFLSGMCGLQSGAMIPNIDRIPNNIKINDIDVKFVDSKDYYSDDVYFEIAIGFFSFYDYPYTDIIFEKCYHKFEIDTNSENKYNFDKNFLDKCGDAISCFSLFPISACHNHTLKEIYPYIKIGNILLNENTNSTCEKYDFNEFKLGDVWINVLYEKYRYYEYPISDGIVTLFGLEPGTYVFEYVKIYCRIESKLRRILADTRSTKVKIVKNGSDHNLLIL